MKRKVRGVVFSFVLFIFLISLMGSVSGLDSITGKAASQPINATLTILPGPYLTIVSPANTTYSDRTILVNLSSNGVNIWYNWNGGANMTYIGPAYVTFNEGSNTLYAYADDGLGNVTSRNVNFSVNITNITTPSGGGGVTHPKPKNASMSVVVPMEYYPVITLDNIGKVNFQVYIRNTGDDTLNNIKISGYVLGDSKLLGMPIKLDRNSIASLGKDKQEPINVEISVTSREILLYEVAISAHSDNPADATNSVFINYIGKNITNVEKTINLAEELIQLSPYDPETNNTLCSDLQAMVDDARAKFAAGDINGALSQAQKALEACKRRVEKLETPESIQRKWFFSLRWYLTIIASLAIIFALLWYLRPIAKRYFALGDDDEDEEDEI